MAVTYGLEADEARSQIANSTLSDDVKQAISDVLAAIPEGEEVTVTEWSPGWNISADTDLLFIKQGSAETIFIPSGVPIVILETDEDVAISADGSQPIIVHGGAGNDTIDLVLSDGEVAEGTSYVWGGDGNDSISAGNSTAYLDGGAGDDTINGGAGDDTIVGGSGSNLLRGGDGNVTFYLADGSDTVEAGSGVDLVSFAEVADDPETAVVEASRENYEVEWQGDKAVVFNLVSNQQSEITGAEYLRWADSAVVVASDDNEGSIARIYETLFDRTGEFDGIKYWLEQYRDGSSVTEIAERIFDSEEASALSDLSNEEFVDLLYRNTLEREADQEGRDYWVNRLAEGDNRVDVTLDFVFADESGQKTADVIHVITDDDQIA